MGAAFTPGAGTPPAPRLSRPLAERRDLLASSGFPTPNEGTSGGPPRAPQGSLSNLLPPQRLRWPHGGHLVAAPASAGTRRRRSALSPPSSPLSSLGASRLPAPRHALNDVSVPEGTYARTHARRGWDVGTQALAEVRRRGGGDVRASGSGTCARARGEGDCSLGDARARGGEEEGGCARRRRPAPAQIRKPEQRGQEDVNPARLT